MLTLFLLFPALLLPPAATYAGSADFRAVNQRAAQALAGLMEVCPGRIWPGYDWKELTVVLGDAGQATHFSVAGGKVNEIAAAELPAHLFRTPYEFFQKDGRSGMAVSAAAWAKITGIEDPERLLPDLIGLAAHEAFHLHGQRGWISRRGPRGTAIPVRWEPRLYRELTYLHLRAALLQARPGALGRAAYWYGLWAKGFAYENDSTTDGYEGTANFVEQVSVALTRVGCQASEAELTRELERRAKTEFPESMNDRRPSLDGEGYLLGAHAALILRAAGNMAWHSEMKSGRTPLELLFEGVSPVAEPAPEALVSSAQAAASEEQGRVDGLLGDSLRLLDSGEAIIASVPFEWHQGSYSPSGFFFDVGRNLQLSPLARGISFSTPAGYAFEAGSGAVKIADSAGPCPGWSFVASRAWLSPERTQLVPAGLSLSGRLRGSVRRAENGRDWFCAE